MITFPTNLSLLDWAAQVVLDLQPHGVFGRLEDTLRWQDWAAQFFNSISIDKSLPNPYHFTDWQDWAERFCGALE